VLEISRKERNEGKAERKNEANAQGRKKQIGKKRKKEEGGNGWVRKRMSTSEQMTSKKKDKEQTSNTETKENMNPFLK